MLFAYPESTRVERALPKSTLYKNVAPSSKQRELLTQQIEKIIWAHKLAPDTLNIKPSANLAEIQVFNLVLKSQVTAVHESLLEYLDKAIPSALIFEVQTSSSLQTVACLKQLSKNGSFKCSSYLYGAIQAPDTKRQPLPISLDVAHLQQQLLATLLPYPIKQGESIDAAIERSLQLNKIAKTIQQLETQLLNKTIQFNKRIEINKQLKNTKQLQTALLDEMLL